MGTWDCKSKLPRSIGGCREPADGPDGWCERHRKEYARTFARLREAMVQELAAYRAAGGT